MDLYKGYVINPEKFWQPNYRISPFNTSFVARNHKLIMQGGVNQDLITSFFGNDFLLCKNGKMAISLALEQFSLKPDDEVWVVTTTGNKYISSCVTEQIEKFCKWSRSKSSKTKLIFVNHEFGFCFNDLEALKSHGLPIIEDKALSLFSYDEANLAGRTGDFVIYSLPKFFPINYGGVLKGNNASKAIGKGDQNEILNSHLSILLSKYLEELEPIKLKRKENYQYLADKLTPLGFTPRFSLSENETPGVFMFNCSGPDLNKLKSFMQGNGIESSVFYGEEAFFVPVHQELVQEDMDFFVHLISYFIEHGA